MVECVSEQALRYRALSSTGTLNSGTLFAVKVSKKMRMGCVSVSDLCSFQIGYTNIFDSCKV